MAHANYEKVMAQFGNDVKITRLVVHPDGSIEPIHKWLCTSPIHYRDILASEMLRYSSSPGCHPGYRFHTESLPLAKVETTLNHRGF